MIKIGSNKDIERIDSYPVEAVSVAKEIIDCLDENYGTSRNIDADLGGYIIIVEKEDDFTEIMEEILIDIKNQGIPEFVDLIKCSNGDVFFNCLLLFNNDFGVSFIIPEHLLPENFKEYIL